MSLDTFQLKIVGTACRLAIAANVGACDGRGLGGLSNAAKRNAKADQL
jgi:hypothetical protein